MPGRVVAVNVAHVIDTPVPAHGEPRDTKPRRSGIDKRPVAGPVRVEPLGLVGDSILDTANHGGLSRRSTPMRGRTRSGGPASSVTS